MLVGAGVGTASDAAYLGNRVLPQVPLRRWVLSLPKVLRFLQANDGKPCRAVSKTAIQEIRLCPVVAVL